jgi:phosphohistidine phosphatase
MRALYLLRHVKSSWDDPLLGDHDRPLARRGRKAGAAMAAYLVEHDIGPELVLCSTATRTRQTLELLEEAVAGAEVAYEEALYAASAVTLLRRLRRVPDEVGSVLLIAHNPGIQQLALALAAPSPRRAAMEDKFPTGALAALRFDGSWSDLAREGLELRDFVRPRDLR